MAFEDLYYQSRTFGLVNLRYSPVDKTLVPVSAIAQAKEIPGVFCVSKVSVRQGFQFKRCIPAEKFSVMKNVLLRELTISTSKMEPEISRVITMDAVLKANLDSAMETFKAFVEEDLIPTFQAKRTAESMIGAINYWNYQDGLCNADAVGNPSK